MKHRRLLSTLLSLAILLSCIGWTPSRAEETTPEVQTEQSQAAEQTEVPVYTEQMSREELPEIVAQEAPVNHGHVGRLENEEQDNLNQFIFLNQDGSKTMYLYDHPVKYRDEAGNIHDISLDIADTDDTAYPFRTEANWAVTAFPRELANGITLESESAQIKMIPILPENSTTVLNHMARRVDEDTVAYTYDSATQLEYQLTYDGFKEEIVVSEYTGQTEYHFFLYTNGLALTQLEGGYYLTDEAGNIQGTIGDIIVFTADERNNTFGQLQAETVKENGIYLLTIVLEADYLADPNTQYPIRIDPTVSLTYAQSGADAIEDVLLQSNSASIGERTVAVIGYSQKGVSRLLMRFPGIDFSALKGVTVTSASVRLRDLMCEEFGMTVTCYPFTGDPWTESTADWSVTQQRWGDALSSHVFSYDNGEAQPTAFWYAFDITSLAQQWANDPDSAGNGIIFKADTSIEEGDTYRYKTIGTYETDGYKPTFTMTYTSVTVTPDTAEIYQGETIDLSAATDPDGLAVTWHSENNAIATVDENGVVTGIAPGSVTITATTANGATAHCVVTVLATQIWLDATSITLGTGQSYLLTATTVPAGLPVYWFTGDGEIANVYDGGSVEAIAPGQTYVTAMLENGTTVGCSVHVVESQITLNCTTMDLDEGAKATLSATTVPANRHVTWTSSDTSIATVSQTGEITGRRVGMVTITASLTNGPSTDCVVWITIPDGVYQIRNVASGLYLDTCDGGATSGTIIQQYTEATTYYRNQLFKITYLSQYNYYSIRPMTNSGMGVSAFVTGNKDNVTIEEMSVLDTIDEIPYSQRWRISLSDQGYTLRNGNIGGSGYLTVPVSDTSGLQIYADSFTPNYSEWQLIPYTGSVLQGVGLKETPSAITCGNAYDYDAYMYSSVIGCNGPVEYSVGSLETSTTNLATINSATGNLHAIDIGNVMVRFSFEGSLQVWGCTLNIVQAGCLPYHLIVENSEESTSINCHGYAFNTNDIPDGWYTYDDYLFAQNSPISSNELLYGTNGFAGMKSFLEDKWLDIYFNGRWEEVFSNDDGWDIALDDNQWLVVFRVGKHGTSWDYHFWYRTDLGKWANKHGWRNGSGSELLTDMPSNDASAGWINGISGFYDSDIIYYVITMGG